MKTVASEQLHENVPSDMQTPMEVDVVIMGGALSGCSVALLLRRELPSLRVLILERSENFDRKVGEATTEISGDFLHRRLGLAKYLSEEHVAKQGLRMWFSGGSETPFDECVEIGARLQSRLPTFQVDREKLDTHLLKMAEQEGATLWRPAVVSDVSFANPTRPELKVKVQGEIRTVTCRWLIDASGRAAFLSRRLGLIRPVPEHPTNAIWARFRNVADWDSAKFRSRHSDYGSTCIVSRGASTNHLTGYGWWCWIIPLRGGDVSAGLVYDSRLFTPPEGATLGERLHKHLMSDPVGREMFSDAAPNEGDIKAYSQLPYFSEKIAGPGWQTVGDAAAFLDPLYSPGMDYCSWTSRLAFARIRSELMGEKVNLDDINARFRQSYDTWFRALYLDKYHYLGDAEIMSTAYLLDIGLFFIGPVREAISRKGSCDKNCLPFTGPVDKAVGRFMKFYNKRFRHIALKRIQAGCYGRNNTGWRELHPGFSTGIGAASLFAKAALRWLRMEIHALTLKAPKGTPADPPTTLTPASLAGAAPASH